MPNLILRLALPSPLRRLFDYLAPAGVSRSALQPGVRLRVPFGRREMIGVLVEVDSQSEVPLDKLKPALELLDARPPLPASLFKLCLWTAQYYLVGIMQKFIDQSISANTNYDPTRFPSGKVPMQQLLKDLLNAYKFGVKTLYYHNTRDGAEDAQDDLAPSIQDDGCESGACKI